MYPFELSGGMARQVLIGTAVVEQPQLVIADEPTPGLHMEAALRVLSHFREIADQGAGVLLITHDLELALKTADKIVVFYAERLWKKRIPWILTGRRLCAIRTPGRCFGQCRSMDLPRTGDPALCKRSS